jgi:hypothetical protein
MPEVGTGHAESPEGIELPLLVSNFAWWLGGVGLWQRYSESSRLRFKIITLKISLRHILQCGCNSTYGRVALLRLASLAGEYNQPLLIGL